MLPDQISPASPEKYLECNGNQYSIIQLACYRNEIGNNIKWHRQVAHKRSHQELP